MSFVKYRLKEVATDFGTTPKEIAEIIGKFGEKPKSNTQVLTDVELNCVFDYMTKNHQIKSLEQVFATAAKKEEPKAAPAAPKAEGRPQQGDRKPQQQGQNRPQRAPVQPAAPKPSDQLFEEKLKAFMSESDTKLSSMRADHRTKSRRR